MNIYIWPETSVDGFAKLTKYNQTKLLAKMAFQRYYSLKTCNVSLHILNTKKQHTCETLSNFFRNVFFWHFLHPELLSVVS